MKKVFFLVIAGLFILNLITHAEQKMATVTTILPMAYLIEQIGGELVDVTVMIPPGANPHTYEPTPAQMNALSNADLFMKVGSGIEFEILWMNKLAALNKKMSICDASRGIRLTHMGEHRPGDEERGQHKHENKDPHIWLSPNNAIVMAGNIRDALIKIDPENKDYYEQNSSRLVVELDALKEEIRSKFKNLKNRTFLIFHPAWGYFAADFNLIQLSAEYSGKEPTPKRLNDLIKKAKRENIKAIFASPQFSKKSAEIIANEINGKVLMIDLLSKDYINNLRTAADAFVESMQ
ncbi:metal ABC transporter solute-binding protein, Zn/Mn family [Thermodesulfobacteriota bacterium]